MLNLRFLDGPDRFFSDKIVKIAQFELKMLLIWMKWSEISYFETKIRQNKADFIG